MKLILNNPYRTIGLLVGSTAAQQNRQINRLRKFIEAEQEPEADFSFPVFGELNRTVETIDSAASKLNLDADRMLASLFWLYSGNSITDEPAFDSIKEGDVEAAIDIWRKLAINSESESFNPVTKRNASAFSNLSTLYLNQYGVDEETVQLKLLFIESDFFNDLVKKATDETFKISQKEAQLLFLKNIVKTDGVDTAEFIDAIIDIEFLAKEDFLKSLVQTPISEIEKKVEESKSKRNEIKSNGLSSGNELYKKTKEDLELVKNILGADNVKYSFIADKLANEILQGSIDYFNECQKKEISTDYIEPSMKLAKLAGTIALGRLVRERINDSIETFEEMIDAEISIAITLLKSVKSAFDENKIKITEQARQQEATLVWDHQSIDWNKVNRLIENSLDWGKVVELIEESIPQKNIIKIKQVKNITKLNEYKILVNFLMSKLSYSHKNKIRYLSYWDTVKPSITGTTTSAKMPSSTVSNSTKKAPTKDEIDDMAINVSIGIGVIVGIIIFFFLISLGNGIGGFVMSLIFGFAGGRISVFLAAIPSLAISRIIYFITKSN